MNDRVAIAPPHDPPPLLLGVGASRPTRPSGSQCSAASPPARVPPARSPSLRRVPWASRGIVAEVFACVEGLRALDECARQRTV